MENLFEFHFLQLHSCLNETQNGKLICSVKHETGCSAMPKYNTKLNSCQIRIFELWQQRNCPQ